MEITLTKAIKDMSACEIVDEMRSGSKLSLARRVFSSNVAKQEQAFAQRKPSSTIELIRMEFEAVLEIAKALGIMVAYKG